MCSSIAMYFIFNADLKHEIWSDGIFLFNLEVWKMIIQLDYHFSAHCIRLQASYFIIKWGCICISCQAWAFFFSGRGSEQHILKKYCVNRKKIMYLTFSKPVVFTTCETLLKNAFFPHLLFSYLGHLKAHGIFCDDSGWTATKKSVLNDTFFFPAVP